MKTFLYFCLSVIVISGYAQPYPQQENTVRVMSYNIHNGKGMDNVTDYQRIAGIITGISPDVVALQELDSVTNRSNQVDVLARLAEHTAMYPVFGASLNPYDGGKYGIAVLSKEKPISWKRIPLPGREEVRSLLIVEFKDYIVGCTHFSLNAEDRQTSVSIINQAVKDLNKPVLLAGDMNAALESPVMEAFNENWTILSDVNMQRFAGRSGRPRRAIDFILGYTSNRHSFTVRQAQIIDEQVASDHLPLFVDVQLN